MHRKVRGSLGPIIQPFHFTDGRVRPREVWGAPYFPPQPEPGLGACVLRPL